MFDLFLAKCDVPSAFVGVVAENVAVIIIVVALLSHNLLLALSFSFANRWAIVVFRYAVCTTELSTAKWASEGHQGFLTASLTLHNCRRLFQS